MSIKYKKLLEQRRKEYKNYTPVFCPCLKEYIYFNSDGFIHLRFHANGIPRKRQERMYKLGLLPLVIPTIKTATTIEKHEYRLAPINRKKKNGQKIMKDMQFWGIISIVGKQNVKLKVVLRKIGTGKICFWSVMKLKENKN